ncbi:MAG: prepilin-type N-terminal cleavage/methylation domain-containing protein [Candidatus Omnitrophica bacterium]|nr:prepilin-type N-terminal cleavage/methylation domain-containing protein [Candidatus Omnitrophota bacterium]MDD4940475.1 prepilin-type N-terminal cleavage/methylation domain-containing protein [Candidatus Omnitrophota bacterium]MDD5774457.1 prepilin-type N-terminal cleavage/methylation domain-containing protein [Candidatus Omnitrophota bacterium]HNQ50991.1 prepilin-type N-terminal cleavage/methylation domain-containing protein [Candidatus Omnitrophota bacterium]HQO38454.1 prepilin-type N-term
MHTAVSRKRGVGLIELIIVVAVLSFFAYIVMKHVTSSPSLDAETQKTLEEHGIDTTNYGTIINTTRDTLNDITKKTSSAIDSLTGGSNE